LINKLSAPFCDYKSRVESALDKLLPVANSGPVHLMEAMRYASLDGGKRIRAMLVYAAGQTVDHDMNDLDPAACAVELIHAYSLVHDDLPAMDNDTLRRGKPTCHIAYDEATGILVGDGLQSLAFETLAGHSSVNLRPEKQLQMIKLLANAAGHAGMVGGQARDMAAQGRKLTLDQLTELHLGKTGALIKASVLLGALSGEGSNPADIEALDEYATRIGLAFQIIDDVLDEEADTKTLGKNSGADRTLSKATFPATIGIEKSRRMARHCQAQALSALDNVRADTQILKAIADLVVGRKH